MLSLHANYPPYLNNVEKGEIFFWLQLKYLHTFALPNFPAILGFRISKIAAGRWDII